MRPQETSAPRVVGVARITSYLRTILTGDKWLRNIGVRGEISNFSTHKSGNVYFDLKDADALLSCVVWSDRARDLPALENGRQVIAYGEIGAFTKASKYQLIAYRVELEGVGRLHEMFERLKRKLDGEGAFAGERKRAIPRYPFRIALVSSTGAAGAGDFLKILRERAPHVHVEFVETAVQGVAAALEIVRGINRAARLDGVDCIVVARGGGSYEDLFAFNTEEVARAILRAPIPVISAIGHESDVTIADLVADRRAETPSAAAHLVAPWTRAELLKALEARTVRLERLARRAIGAHAQQLDRAVEMLEGRLGEARRRRSGALASLEKRLGRFDPRLQLAEREKKIELARVRLTHALERRLRRASERLALLRSELRGKDPEAILQQGYAIVRHDGRAVRDVAAVPDGATVSAQLARGTLVARVERKEADGEQVG
ncbi:MAG: exodeoxyribonuclease VII large subunit [Candidatus Eremiobacteraeota bacterium]|nr:exodeoxyribonuclease VII large subunit [Candidatus Eremiobacteraeota bacterium]